MQYTELGTTGVEVSVMSLGGGGFSKLGLSAGKSERDARRIIETALDNGINLVDTAEKYGTESVIGAVVGDRPRDDLVLSTKFDLSDDGALRPPADIEAAVRGSLDRLNTEYIDVYHLHGVAPEDYEYARDELYPELARLKEMGLIRFAGLSQKVSTDSQHEMLTRAVADGMWDVVMVGFNLLNHAARERVLEPAAAKGIGTIGMVAVRRALSDPTHLAGVIRTLFEYGDLDPSGVDPEDPFGFLVHEAGADDLVDAAYRFARHEPGIDTVLTGTANEDHLLANIESAVKPPLPEADRRRLDEQFGHIDSVLGD